MITAASSRKLLLLLAILATGGLTGCVTDPMTGEKKFNPWKSAQNADEKFGDLIDKANTSPDPRAPDWWNPD